MSGTRAVYVGVIGLALGACDPMPPPTPSEWELVAIDGKAVPSPRPTVRFASDQHSQRVVSGCGRSPFQAENESSVGTFALARLREQPSGCLASSTVAAERLQRLMRECSSEPCGFGWSWGKMVIRSRAATPFVFSEAQASRRVERSVG